MVIFGLIMSFIIIIAPEAIQGVDLKNRTQNMDWMSTTSGRRRESDFCMLCKTAEQFVLP